MIKRIVTLLGALASLLAAPLSAEMYQCVGPSGVALYTTDRSQCAGEVSTHELTGSIQRSKSSSVMKWKSHSGTERQEMAAAKWRARKVKAQKEVLRLKEKVASGEKLVTACNRGVKFYKENENGIPETVACDTIKREYAVAVQELDAQERYLKEGLAEECRRQGCLPGWIR